MGKMVPFRQPHRRAPRWTKARDYGVPESPPRAGGDVPWFPIVLVALPLAVFSAVFFAPQLGYGPDSAGAVPLFQSTVQPTPDTERARFPICDSGPRITCVVDGDTIWYQGTKIRIADIDTPEVSEPGCANEARMGRKATLRLQALLNAGAFTLAPNPDGRDTDRYGRALCVVTRGGSSVGDTLVDEGLAERWGGMPVRWC